MLRILLVLVLLLAPTALFPQADLMNTGGYLNGRAWSSYGKALKLGFVMGYWESFVRAKAVCKINAMWFSGSPSYGEVVAGVDDFYSEPANMNIPIHNGLEIVANKFNGFPEERVRQNIELLRKAYLNIR